MELTQKELEEMVNGRPADPNVTFFEKAVLNPAMSKASGRRIYDTHTFIQKKYPGVTDFVPHIATAQDLKKYSVEYQNFLAAKPSRNSPPIEIIPNLNLSEQQELRDIGFGNIRQLAEAEVVPQHLSKAQRMAQVILNAMENPDGEEDIKEDRITEEVEALSADRRQRHDDHVGQPEPPGSPGDDGRETGEGLQADRRVHNRQNLNADFSFEVTYR